MRHLRPTFKARVRVNARLWVKVGVGEKATIRVVTIRGSTLGALGDPRVLPLSHNPPLSTLGALAP